MTAGVVLRVGELFLKGQNRPFFERALLDRVRRIATRHGELKVHRGQGRIFIEGSASRQLVDEMAEVFGLVSVSPVVYVERDLEEITKIACDMAKDAQRAGASTFRIRAKRADKRFELTSTQINVHVGAKVVEETGLGVDLERYDLEVGIEIGTRFSFVFNETFRGRGGLPVGVGGVALLLISGGIDSPVAGHLMQKRGLRLQCVHFHSAPWTTAASQEKVRQLAKCLASRQGSLELHMVPFGPAQEEIRDGADESYRVILYRRLMLRIAEKIGRGHRAKALVTGDSLGQVASQTVENLSCIGAVTDMLILRPLLGFDKAEVIEMAKEIDTYEVSIQPHEDCCSLFVPRHPEIKGSADRAARLEEGLDVNGLVERALRATETELIEG